MTTRDTPEAERLARAIHAGRIMVAKHGKFTARCICNDLATSILRGMAGMVPKPSLDQMVAEFAVQTKPTRDTPEAALAASWARLWETLGAAWTFLDLMSPYMCGFRSSTNEPLWGARATGPGYVWGNYLVGRGLTPADALDALDALCRAVTRQEPKP